MYSFLADSIAKMDLEGRDSFHTHLITQEIPFWLELVYCGKVVMDGEVENLIVLRGFNADESRKFRALAAFMNDNAEKIRATEPISTKINRYCRGFRDGVSERSHEFHIASVEYNDGYNDGYQSYQKALKSYVEKIERTGSR